MSPWPRSWGQAEVAASVLLLFSTSHRIWPGACWEDVLEEQKEGVMSGCQLNHPLAISSLTQMTDRCTIVTQYVFSRKQTTFQTVAHRLLSQVDFSFSEKIFFLGNLKCRHTQQRISQI